MRKRVMIEPVTFSVFIATSLDGYIARTDGDVSWLDEQPSAGEGEDFGYGEFFASVDALVMGRGTFEKIMEFDWPYEDKPLIVLSHSLQSVPESHRGRVTIEKAGPADLTGRLAERGYRRIYLDGGQVITSFLRQGLVNDMIITHIPVLLGNGLPLFGHLDRDIPLELLASRSWDNGFVQTHYKVVR
jgi:dihydrofolate reductase